LNFLNNEATSKREGLLRELVPEASRLAVLVNPGNSPAMETALQVTEPAACLLGWPIEIFKAGTNREIEEAFEAMAAAQVKILSSKAIYTLRVGALNSPRSLCLMESLHPIAFAILLLLADW